MRGLGSVVRNPTTAPSIAITRMVPLLRRTMCQYSTSPASSRPPPGMSMTSGSAPCAGAAYRSGYRVDCGCSSFMSLTPLPHEAVGADGDPQLRAKLQRAEQAAAPGRSGHHENVAGQHREVVGLALHDLLEVDGDLGA